MASTPLPNEHTCNSKRSPLQDLKDEDNKDGIRRPASITEAWRIENEPRLAVPSWVVTVGDRLTPKSD